MKELRKMAIAGALCLSVFHAHLLSAEKDEEEYRAKMRKEWVQEIAENRIKDSAAFSELMRGVDSLEVFILDPAAKNRGADKPAAEDRLDGWKIVQHLQTSKPREIEQLTVGLKLSIETSPSGATPCFEPRHALRFTKNGREVIVLVCFECVGMEVKGYPQFEGASVSHAAAKEFYRLFRAHGQTRANRLAGLSDQDIAGKLAGKWRSKSRQATGAVDGRELAFETVSVLAPDGTYQNKGKVGFVSKDGQEQLFRETSEKGKWRVQEGMLILLDPDPDDINSSAPIEFWSPLMEVSRDRYVEGSLLPGSTQERVIERIE